MKKIVFGLMMTAALLLSAACENTIRYEYDPTDALITLHAQMTTAEASHTVFLSMSYPDRVEALPGATVSCTVNGVLYVAEEQPVPEEEYYEYDPATNDYVARMRPRSQHYTEYTFPAEFKPGDEIRVEAVKGNLHARADVTVPQPARFVKVDTATVVRTVRYVDFGGDESWDYTYMDVAATIRDASAEDSYFTLTASSLTEGEIRYYGEDEAPERTEPFRYEQKGLSYETFHDNILEDGYTAAESSSLLAELMATNLMHCFSDKAFPGGEATVCPSFSVDYFYPRPYGSYYWYVPEGTVGELHPVFRLHLRTISRDCYNYLRAMNNMETYGYDVTPIIEPTMLPSNVTGGMGLVSVAAEDIFVIDPNPGEVILIDRRNEIFY